MANLEVLALDTATPQIRAPGAGDGYSVPRDITLSNNLIFGSTAQRITGDMSNATVANRLAFQTSTANSNTSVAAIPSGTATQSAFNAFNASDPTNSSTMQLICATADSRLTAGATGTGTYLPMTFYTGGSERMRLDTSGNLGIGTASPGTKLDVQGTAAGAGINSRAVNNDTGATASASFQVTTGGGVSATMFAYGNSAAYLSTTSNHPLVFQTNNTERMRIDSSGNVGIGGTAAASRKLELLGTLPGTGTSTRAVSVVMTCPSTSTASSNGFLSTINTAEASFTLDILRYFAAFQGTFGAGSAVTNQYGFFVDSSLTGATNNYGFYSNIASAANRWNFYAAGTARNYFAGRTDVGNTRIAASNNWNGVSIDTAGSVVTVADGATITLTSVVCGAVMVHVYDANSGQGGVFFATYNTTVTKVAGDGEATDTGSTFAVYKSAGSHTLTFKNKYGGAARNFSIAIYAAYAE